MKLTTLQKFFACLILLLGSFAIFGAICAINDPFVQTYPVTFATVLTVVLVVGMGGTMYFGFNLTEND